MTAAYELLKQTDIKPIVCEKTNAIGGISQTVEHHGNRMDIGGHRFFSKSDQVMNWWEDVMPLQSKPSKDDILLNETEKEFAKVGPDPEKEDRTMLLRRRVSRIYSTPVIGLAIALRAELLVRDLSRPRHKRRRHPRK